MLKDIQLLDESDFTRMPTDKLQEHYGELVELLIRKRYSVGAEFAILRQRDEKPEEFAEYNAYAEQCKRAVRAKIAALKG